MRFLCRLEKTDREIAPVHVSILHMIKFLILTSVGLFLTTAYCVYHLFDQAITINHLQMAVKGFTERETCLLVAAQSFADTQTEKSVREWARTKFQGLDYHEEESKLIINGVGIEFYDGKVTVN